MMRKVEARAILRASKTMSEIGIIASRGKKARSEKQKAATMRNYKKMKAAQPSKGSKRKRKRSNSILGL